TRFSRDWSSDVCSSDLLLKHAVRLYHRAIRAHHPLSAHGLVDLLSSDTDPHNTGAHWTAAHAPLTDPYGVAFLLEVLHEVGREEIGRAAGTGRGAGRL